MKRLALSFVLLASMAFNSDVARAGMITTTFASNNSFTGNMFDVTTSGNALIITGFDVNLGSVGTPTPISVYYRSGTYVGNETSPAGWILAGTVNVISQGTDNMTFVDTADFGIAGSSVTGLYVTVNTNVNAPPYMRYTNGSNTYSNADLTINTGVGLGGLFGSLGVFNPRTWNGTIHYDLAPTNAVPAPAGLLLGLTGLPLVGIAGWVRRRRTAIAV